MILVAPESRAGRQLGPPILFLVGGAVQYFKIRHWSKWQSYRSDRSQPPWIKLHRCVMRCPEWVVLSDAERGQLVSIWMLAADRDGEIPADPVVVQRLCHMSSKPNIEMFIEQGFIERDANVTPTGCHDGANVTQQTRLDKTRLDETRKTNGRFAPPTVEQVTDYCQQRKNNINPSRFIDYYQSNGWKVTKGASMKDWKAAVRNWEGRQKERQVSGNKNAAMTHMDTLKEIYSENQ